MSKKLLITALAIALVCMLIAVITALTRSGGEEEESSAEVIEGTEILVVPSEMPSGITMNLPPGFTETASDRYDKYFILNDASVIVTGDTLPDYNQSAEEYAKGVKEQYQQTADNFQLRDEETAQITNVPAVILEFTYDITGESAVQPMQCTTAILVKYGKVYIITCKSHADTFSTYRGSFRQMIDSIEIRNDQMENLAPAPSTITIAPETAPQTVLTEAIIETVPAFTEITE